MTAAASPDAEGLVHLGLHHDSDDGFLAVVVPLVRDALASGQAVSTLVDRRTARDLRAAVGSTAPRGTTERLTDRSPHELRGGSLEQLRVVPRWVEPDRRTLVVGQYLEGLSAADCTTVEDGVNLVLPGLPLTLVCSCGAGDADLVRAWRRGHPGLLSPSGAVEANDAFRVPVDHSPVPAGLWGEPALSMVLHGVADLAHVRDEVARVAGQAGLAADDADAAVLAVHEAAVLLVEGAGGADADGAAGRLEVRTGPHGVFSELRAGPGWIEPGALRYVDLFSAATSLRQDADGRVLRVLTRR